MWKYGDAGDRIPVQDGDVWTVGEHIFLCGDLERGDADRLLTLGTPQLMYSDPPWNMGNARSFRTKAGQAMPEGATFHTLLTRIVAVAAKVGEAWIEMGNATEPVLRTVIEDARGRVVQSYGITYYRKHPCRLVRAAWRGTEPMVSILEGLDDDFTPARVIEECTRPGETVIDVCAGRGLTAVTAHSLGRRALTMELHPRRMAVAMDKLVKLGAGEPVLTSRAS